MDLYCIICGSCSWNKLGNENYNSFIKSCKVMSDEIKNNKSITDERLLNYVDKYNKMDKYLDEKTFDKIKKNMEFMDNIILLGQNNKVIKNPTWISNNSYDDPEEEIVERSYYVYPSYYETMTEDDRNFIGAKLIHTDCYRYIKHKYHKELKYSDFDKSIVKYENIPDKNIYENMKFPPLNIKFGEIENYWSNDYGFLIWNIIIDKKYYLLESTINLIKKMHRMQKKITKKSNKKSSKKSSNKSTNKLNRNIKRMDKMENDFDKIVDCIDYIYKQIIK
jgi:hypothetical protein